MCSMKCSPCARHSLEDVMECWLHWAATWGAQDPLGFCLPPVPASNASAGESRSICYFLALHYYCMPDLLRYPKMTRPFVILWAAILWTARRVEGWLLETKWLTMKSPDKGALLKITRLVESLEEARYFRWICELHFHAGGWREVAHWSREPTDLAEDLRPGPSTLLGGSEPFLTSAPGGSCTSGMCLYSYV